MGTVIALLAAMSELDVVLRSTFGFESFRDGQLEIIKALLAGESALAVFPTGAGKSLCYQLPALTLDGITLVVSPLIALMKDQIDFLSRRGIAAARLDSSLAEAEAQEVARRLREGSLRLLYVAPERFNNERFLALLDSLPIALFAIDEAHCISEWGHNFRPDYLKLAETARRIGAERVLALTATATPSVIADIRAAFAISERNTVVTGFYRPNLELLTTATSSGARDALLVERLLARPRGTTLVYVTLQNTAERVAATLARHGLPARAYHAGLESSERAAVQDWWQRSEAAIVVATIAFGMGINKPNVRYVYHYNMPKSLEGYMQEIGRAGRDGLPSIVELFASSADLGALESFSYGDTPTATSVKSLVAELLSFPERFDIGLAELSVRHDLRPLVLRTALTYLELDGALRQGTAFYAEYQARPRAAWRTGELGGLVERIFAHAKRGRSWYSIRPDDIALALGCDRAHVVRSLEQVAERGLIELRASEARLPFRHLARPSEGPVFVSKLLERFSRRESLAIAQVNDVVSLVTARECQTNALVAHFGERRATPCGHCSFCVRGAAEELSVEQPLGSVSTMLDALTVRRLAAAHPRALGEPRQLARFLCGLTSPATSAAKLSRHALFGALEQHRFTDVLAWCETTKPSSVRDWLDEPSSPP